MSDKPQTTLKECRGSSCGTAADYCNECPIPKRNDKKIMSESKATNAMKTEAQNLAKILREFMPKEGNTPGGVELLLQAALRSAYKAGHAACDCGVLTKQDMLLAIVGGNMKTVTTRGNKMFNYIVWAVLSIPVAFFSGGFMGMAASGGSTTGATVGFCAMLFLFWCVIYRGFANG